VTDGPRTAHDDLLGALLRQLDVPEHRPEFYAELHYRLAEERRVRAAEERRRRRARRNRIRWTARTAFAAAAAAIAALVVGTPWGDQGADTATAAEIKAKVATALASADSLSGEIVFQGSSYRNAYGWDGPKRWSFALSARGDLRLKETDGANDMAYDAREGTERSLNTSESIAGNDTLFAAERRGLAPGPPDQGPSESFLQRDYGSIVRALLAAEDPRVTETIYDGRAAWRLAVAVEPNQIVPELSGDEFVITVDQASGFPLRIVERKAGEVLDEIRLDSVEVDPELSADDFTIRFPEGSEVARTDSGFRRVRIDEVEDRIGYAPLVPTQIPAGYQLAEVAVARRAPQTGVEGGNPLSRDVVSLAYRRGLDRFVVTTRLRRVPGFPDGWDDPLATGEGYRDEPETISLSGGALDGVEAELLVVPRNTPHIWAKTDKLVVTIAGDLSGAELVAVAESLQAR
jgi:outer membrane lipoprotein-sorting protein